MKAGKAKRVQFCQEDETDSARSRYENEISNQLSRMLPNLYQSGTEKLRHCYSPEPEAYRVTPLYLYNGENR